MLKERGQTNEEDQLHASLLQIGSVVIIIVGCIMVVLKFDIICISLGMLFMFIVMNILISSKVREVESQETKEADTDAGDICEDDCIGNGLL